MSGAPPRWEMLRPGAPHIWRTLGYRAVEAGDGRMVIDWDADEAYAFPDTSDSVVVHGGMVAALLDTAMGAACASALTDGQSFLTARGGRIYDGPDEVHRMVVSRRILRAFADGEGWQFS